MIKKIGIIGSGNLAFHLGRAFYDSGVPVGLYGRNVEKAKETAQKIHALHYSDKERLSAECDLLFLAVSDDHIAETSRSVPPGKAVLAHCSGSVPLEYIEEKHRFRAVFYPLQSFSSENRLPEWKNVPVFLECNDMQLHAGLEKLARKITQSVYWISSEKRSRVHLAAVLASNFSNALFIKAEELLQKEELPFDLLLPLISETLSRLKDTGPKQSQTGPARRGDHGVIQKHLRYLEQDPRWQEIYRSFTKVIEEIYRLPEL
jgi:predicted short-subunit dehydrogenase-like oxidoreductase (DUF2520 family)